VAIGKDCLLVRAITAPGQVGELLRMLLSPIVYVAPDGSEIEARPVFFGPTRRRSKEAERIGEEPRNSVVQSLRRTVPVPNRATGQNFRPVALFAFFTSTTSINC
jgi:hypothetical protein